MCKIIDEYFLYTLEPNVRCANYLVCDIIIEVIYYLWSYISHTMRKYIIFYYLIPLHVWCTPCLYMYAKKGWDKLNQWSCEFT